jgi:hypothetical protein
MQNEVQLTELRVRAHPVAMEQEVNQLSTKLCRDLTIFTAKS